MRHVHSARSAESVLDVFIFNTCILLWSLIPFYCLMSGDEAALEEQQSDPNARFRFLPLDYEANSFICTKIIFV